MRRFVLILAAMVAVVLGVPAMAAADNLVGVLVDSACYAKLGSEESTEADHVKCAIACAQKGHRLALVTATGGVYMVTGALTLNNNAQLIPLMNQSIVLTGTVGTLVLQSAPPSSAPLSGVAPGAVARRPIGNQVGVVTKTVRQGDFREGDVPNRAVMAIAAISVQLVPVLGISIP